jgi:hypothetical protein
MGALTSSRSIGLFLANIIMGFMYAIGPMYAYSLSAILALTAAFVLLASVRKD